MALWLSGCFGIQFAALSLVFDPLGPEVAGPASPKPNSTFIIRDFFRRASLSAVSLYIFHAIILNVTVRSISYVRSSDTDTYMFFTPLWTFPEWVGDLVLSLLGIVYFIFWEVVLNLWFTRGKAIGTTEWIMGQGANLAWKLFTCTCFPPLPPPLPVGHTDDDDEDDDDQKKKKKHSRV